MKTLYLMRHAKASHDMQGITDIDRPLLEEGIETTRLVSGRLRDLKVHIKNIVSSPALRAKGTAELIAHSYGVEKDDIQVFQDLYKADIPAFEDCIYSLPDDWDHVLLVSHNPGISEFASQLADIPDNLPTAGLVSLSFDMEKWINLFAAKPVINFFLHPKEIKGN